MKDDLLSFLSKHPAPSNKHNQGLFPRQTNTDRDSLLAYIYNGKSTLRSTYGQGGGSGGPASTSRTVTKPTFTSSTWMTHNKIAYNMTNNGGRTYSRPLVSGKSVQWISFILLRLSVCHYVSLSFEYANFNLTLFLWA